MTLQPYIYLLVNLLTVIICFSFSFHQKIQFNKHFAAFLKASLLVAVPFIAWDIWFTKMGVWWFDGGYTLGYRIAGLPLEEWMFFVFIPFSCVFTYYCLNKYFDLSWANRFNKIILWITILVCVTTSLMFYDRIYPLVTALVTVATVTYLYYLAKVNWLGKASLVYLILMLGFFPVNGVLTGTGLESPIVNYNPEEILNIRMLTIPIEDAVYGYTLFLLNLHLFQLFHKPQPLSRKPVKSPVY